MKQEDDSRQKFVQLPATATEAVALLDDKQGRLEAKIGLFNLGFVDMKKKKRNVYLHKHERKPSAGMHTSLRIIA